jgi:hypothetical protein
MAPTGEIHLQLYVGFAEDPKVRALARYGREARGCRDLYVQMLCFSKRNRTDGHVTDDELGVLVYPEAPKVGRRDALRLVEVGLIEQTPGGGYRVLAYLKRNKSRAEIEGAGEASSQDNSSNGTFGNHTRWHTNRSIVDPECRHCASPSDRGGESPPDRPPIAPRIAIHRTETETETETDTGDGDGDEAMPSTTAPSPREEANDRRRFGEFWLLYPRRENRGKAENAWNIAVTKADPNEIIAGLRRYLPVAAKAEKRYIPYPATWLNDRRWDDVHQPQTVGADKPEWYA